MASQKGFKPDQWKEIWGAGMSPWHRAEVHQLLTKHLNLAFKDGGKKKWYIPMCGKAVELKWLSDQGHTVVGVEFVETAVEAFFDEQQLAYDVFPCPQVQGQVYKSQQGDICIYCCDIFRFNKEIESTFNAVWDCGAMQALPGDERAKYCELMKGMVSPAGQIFLISSDYDQSVYKGPPYVIPIDDVKKYFGDEYNVARLDECDASDCSPKELTDLGEKLTDVLYLINRK